MLQRLTLLLVFLSVSCVQAQVFYSNLQSDPAIRGSKQKANNNSKTASITLTLPFIEDFSGYTGNPDSTKFLNNGGVFVNNRYPVLPPTINAASFDGIDQNGTAYDFGEDPFIDGETDELESCDIDLSALSIASNVKMSFYWQKGSFLENNAPDDNDSLVLQFKDNAGTWSNIWSEVGDSVITQSSTNTFQYVCISLDSAKYFHNGFRFRFKSYGRRTGRYDIWNVDYIFIAQNRLTTAPYPELGFSTDPTSILKDYETMPYKHFLAAMNSYINDSVCALVYNQNTSATILNDTLMAFHEEIRDVQIESTLTTGGNTGINPGESIKVCWTPSIDSLNNQLGPLDSDSSYYLKYKLNINTADTLRQNDSTVKITKLENYYAYDDGTVEGGAGIGKKEGRIVVEFDIPMNDTLIGVDILFPRQSPDLSGKGLKILIMDELEGINGGTNDNVLFQPFQSLTYDSTLNGFHTYNFESSPTPIQAGKLYVGYQQFTNEVIYAGLDANTDNLDKVHIDVNGAWIPFLNATDSTVGSLMIRPIFNHFTLAEVLTTIEKEFEQLEVTIFPNPTSKSLNTSVLVDNITIYNIIGQTIMNIENIQQNQIDVSNLKPGTYIVKLLKGKAVATKRLVIR